MPMNGKSFSMRLVFYEHPLLASGRITCTLLITSGLIMRLTEHSSSWTVSLAIPFYLAILSTSVLTLRVLASLAVRWVCEWRLRSSSEPPLEAAKSADSVKSAANNEVQNRVYNVTRFAGCLFLALLSIATCILERSSLASHEQWMHLISVVCVYKLSSLYTLSSHLSGIYMPLGGLRLYFSFGLEWCTLCTRHLPSIRHLRYICVSGPMASWDIYPEAPRYLRGMAPLGQNLLTGLDRSYSSIGRPSSICSVQP
jgi:hypothetical protein